jgi:hypothetical protein
VVVAALGYGPFVRAYSSGIFVTRERRVRRSVPAAGCSLIISLALLGACTSASSDGPTATTTSSSASPSPVSSSASPTLSSGSVTSSSASLESSSSPSSVASSNPWPADLPPDQVTAAQAAIAAYTGFWGVVDQAFGAPGQDWSASIASYATASAQDNLLEGLSQTANRGQYRTGSVKISPQVTQVDAGLVTITDCVDSTYVDLFNSDGVSIKAPNAPGSYERHVLTAHVGQFQSEQWLVSDTVEDWSKPC